MGAEKSFTASVSELNRAEIILKRNIWQKVEQINKGTYEQKGNKNWQSLMQRAWSFFVQGNLSHLG